MEKPSIIVESQPCPLCNGKEFRTFFQCKDADMLTSNIFEVRECRLCGLAYTYPYMDNRSLEPWYGHQYHGWWQSIKNHPFEVVKQLFQFNRYRFIKNYFSKGRLVDIGSGDGTFIRFMQKQGWQAFGIEQADKYIAYSKKISNKVETFKSSASGLVKFKQNIDLVTLWHVLEHVENPAAILRQAFFMLKDAGLLVISVPNFESLQARWGKDKWFHLDLPRHRWHFTAKTLKKQLESEGFSMIKCSHFSLEYNPYGWWQTILNKFLSTHNFAYNLIKRRNPPKNIDKLHAFYNVFCLAIIGPLLLPISSFLAYVESALNRGGSITVIARKNQTGDSHIDY